MGNERPMVSGAALSTFQTYLPSDLTEEQAERVLEAAGALAQQVWKEATNAHAVLTAVRHEYRRVSPEGGETK